MERLEWQDFTIEKKKTASMGQGANAIIVVAKWMKRNQKMVVVKLITESFCTQKDLDFDEEKENLLSEGNVLLHANQKAVQNIVSIYGTVDGLLPSHISDLIGIYADENDAAYGLVLEYIEGVRNLSAVLYPKIAKQPKSPLSMVEQVYILREISFALADVHIIGLIHGDIKPQNILMSTHTPPLIKLIDFGLSKLRETASLKAFGNSTLKSTVNFKGTMFYSAPEMLTAMTSFASGATASRSTDIYAFAILCWEILTQRRPFENDTNFPQSVIDGKRPSLDELPSDTPATIRKMLELCWSADRNVRLSAVECVSILCHEYEVLASGKFDIFFSHAWDNKPFLSHVHRFLVRGGHRVWYDQKDMGHDLIQSMIHGIESSKIVLICLNHLYLSRENCLFELREAHKRNKILVILLIEPKMQQVSHEALDLCQLKRKLYVDIGELASLSYWYDKSELGEVQLVELNEQLGPLFALLKKVDCLPSCLSPIEEEEEEVAKVEVNSGNQSDSGISSKTPALKHPPKEYEIMHQFIEKEDAIVVIDMGTISTRIGFQDDRVPIEVPTIYGYSKAELHLPLLSRSLAFGDEAFSLFCNEDGVCVPMRNPDHPFYWKSESSEILLQFFRYLFQEKLYISPSNCRILFIEPSGMTHREYEMIIQVCLRLEVLSFLMIPSAMAVMAATDSTYGLVVQCNEDNTIVSCVFGLTIIHQEKVMIGGKDITNFIMDQLLLVFFYRNAFGYSLEWNAFRHFEKARSLKTDVTSFSWIRSEIIPQALPLYYKNRHDLYPTLDQAIGNCLIFDPDGDTQELFSQHVVISGNSSRLPDFVPTLRKLLPSCTNLAVQRARIGRITTSDMNPSAISKFQLGAGPTCEDSYNQAAVEKLLKRIRIISIEEIEKQIGITIPSLEWVGGCRIVDSWIREWPTTEQIQLDFFTNPRDQSHYLRYLKR